MTPPTLDEIWKPVLGYEGCYEVSNHGNVRGVERKVKSKHPKKQKLSGKVLRQDTTWQGYKVVRLCKNGKRKGFGVHRLVALSFVKGYRCGLVVNHIDELKDNNHSCNLEWVTHSKNLKYSGVIKKSNEVRRRPVIKMDLNGKLINSFKSISEASKNGFSQAGVCRACNSENGIYKGFIWRYNE